MKRTCLPYFVFLIWSWIVIGQSPQEKVSKIFESRCFRCHGKSYDGKIRDSGKMGNVTNLGGLVSSGRIKPGSPELSVLYQRIVDKKDPMPPEGATPLTQEEKNVVRDYIMGLKNEATETKKLVRELAKYSQVEIHQTILDDLAKLKEEDRKNVGYLIFHPLAARGVRVGEFDEYAEAAVKLFNTLSWEEELVHADVVDKTNLFIRINLKRLNWASNWDVLQKAYPYVVKGNPGTKLDLISKKVTEQTGKTVPFFRVDWFVAYCAHPRIYLTLLNNNAKSFVHSSGERVLQAGFEHSRVSMRNRLVRRKSNQPSGRAYWETFDFGADDSSPRANIFNFPLLPIARVKLEAQKKKAFQHLGGEAIFHLPNKLFAYYLYDKDLNYINVGPLNAVGDPREHYGIVNFESCVRCHDKGLKSVQDNLWEHVEVGDYPLDVQAAVKETHDSEKAIQEALVKDNEAHFSALKKIDPSGTGMLQIFDLRDRYNKALSKEEFLAELPEFQFFPRAYWNRKQVTVNIYDKVAESFPSGKKISRVRAEGLTAALLPYVELKGQASPSFTSLRFFVVRYSKGTGTWSQAYFGCTSKNAQLPSVRQLTEILAQVNTSSYLKEQIAFDNQKSYWTRDVYLENGRVLAKKIPANSKNAVCWQDSCLRFRGEREPSPFNLFRAAVLHKQHYFPFFLKSPQAHGFYSVRDYGAGHGVPYFCVQDLGRFE